MLDLRISAGPIRILNRFLSNSRCHNSSTRPAIRAAHGAVADSGVSDEAEIVGRDDAGVSQRPRSRRGELLVGSNIGAGRGLRLGVNLVVNRGDKLGYYRSRHVSSAEFKVYDDIVACAEGALAVPTLSLLDHGHCENTVGL